jgi:hypothetical protein
MVGALTEFGDRGINLSKSIVYLRHPNLKIDLFWFGHLSFSLTRNAMRNERRAARAERAKAARRAWQIPSLAVVDSARRL